MAITRRDAINDALERLYAVGFSKKLAPIARLREDAMRPDPMYRVAAEAVLHRLKPMA